MTARTTAAAVPSPAANPLYAWEWLWQQLAAATLQAQVNALTQASRLLNGAATATPAARPKAAAKRSRRA